MKVAFAALSDVGRTRDHNEDCFLVDREVELYVMCDGMGGHKAGELASRLAVETVHKVVKQHTAALELPETEEARSRAMASLLRAAIEDANRAVYALGRKEESFGAGTTCTTLLVRGTRAALGHVGDSRAYLARNRQVTQLSQDHTFAAEALRRGVLSAKELAGIPEAAYLTRAVGPHLSVLVDTLVFDLLPGDTLLLCSDGLHGYLEADAELLALLGGDVEEIPKELVALANSRGGEDNITAVAVRVLDDATLSGTERARATEVTANFATLRSIDLFSELTMSELTRVAEVLRSASYGADEPILLQSDKSESLFMLVDGSAVVERDGKHIALLEAGTHFGEMALLTQRPRTATVRAAEPCRVLVLEREAFYRLAQHDHVLGMKFVWKLAQTLSTRLDDAYPSQRGPTGRTTVRYGLLYPSPFSEKEPRRGG